jgi:hypothetical protein
MRVWRPALVLAVLWLGLATAPASAQVRLAINNGQVSLSATNATLRQILAEWARVGHTTIVNGDRVGGAPITIELSNVAETSALEVILRSVSGYVLAPRRGSDPGPSMFDRILIVPTSNGVRAAVPAPSPAAFPQPQIASAAPQPDDDRADDSSPAQQPAPAQPNAARTGFSLTPSFTPSPAPQMTNDGANTAPVAAPAPAAPAGVPTPGMFLPPRPDPQSQQPGGQQPR